MLTNKFYSFFLWWPFNGEFPRKQDQLHVLSLPFRPFSSWPPTFGNDIRFGSVSRYETRLSLLHLQQHTWFLVCDVRAKSVRYKRYKKKYKRSRRRKMKNVCLGSEEKDLAENTHSIYNIDIRYTINLMLSCIIWFEWSEHRTLHTHATRWCCKCFAIERKRLLTLDG